MRFLLIPPLIVLFLTGVGFMFAPQLRRAVAWCDRQPTRTLGLLIIAQTIVLGLLIWAITGFNGVSPA